MNSSRYADIELRPDEVVDDFMEGRLKIIQSRRGYRFSIDAILLSQFVSARPKDIVVDLGTGCGVIPLILLLRRPLAHVYGLEIQAGLAQQAARNALLNGFSDKIGIILGDMRHVPLKPSFADLVVCNPPYRKMNSGRINPNPQKAIARHEIMTSLNDILSAAKRLLKLNGRLAMIYPAFRLTDILGYLRDQALEPKRMQVIYPALKSEAKLVMLEACLGGKSGLKIYPPLIDQGDFSTET